MLWCQNSERCHSLRSKVEWVWSRLARLALDYIHTGYVRHYGARLEATPSHLYALRHTIAPPPLPTIKYALDRPIKTQLCSWRVGGRRVGGTTLLQQYIYLMQQKNSAGICVHAIIIRCARRITTLQELISVYSRTTTLQEYISTRSAAISVQGNAQVSWAHRGHGIPKHWPDRRIGVIVLSNILVLSLLA